MLRLMSSGLIGLSMLLSHQSRAVVSVELPRMDHAVVYHECSHHAPQRELRVGLTSLGTEGIEIKSLTYYGTCVSLEIYDIEAQKLVLLGPHGPACYQKESDPEVLTAEHEGFWDAFSRIELGFQQAFQGNACLAAQPELEATLRYLTGVRAFIGSKAEF